MLFSETLAAPPWGSIILPYPIDLMPGLSFAVANEIGVEMIYVYFWAEALSQNIVSYILFSSLLWQSADLNRCFFLTLKSDK